MESLSRTVESGLGNPATAFVGGSAIPFFFANSLYPSQVHYMCKSNFLIVLAFVVGCGETQPPELENATVTVIGTPEAEVYLSVDRTQRTVQGKESATIGFTDSGKRVLDENGRFEKTYDSYHGLEVVLVALNDDPLKLSVNADNVDEQSAEVSGQLKHANLKLGYRPDPDSMFAANPDESVDSARKFIGESSDEE